MSPSIYMSVFLSCSCALLCVAAVCSTGSMPRAGPSRGSPACTGLCRLRARCVPPWGGAWPAAGVVEPWGVGRLLSRFLRTVVLFRRRGDSNEVEWFMTGPCGDFCRCEDRAGIWSSMWGLHFFKRSGRLRCSSSCACGRDHLVSISPVEVISRVAHSVDSNIHRYTQSTQDSIVLGNIVNKYPRGIKEQTGYTSHGEHSKAVQYGR